MLRLKSHCLGVSRMKLLGFHIPMWISLFPQIVQILQKKSKRVLTDLYFRESVINYVLTYLPMEVERMDKRTTDMVAYLTWIGLLVALFLGDRDHSKFHLNQALVIWLFGLLSVIPCVGFIIGIAAFILAIMGFISALNGEEKALPPVLIVPKRDFFDFHDKYAADGAAEICPAPLPEEVTARVQAAAVAAHRCLGLAGYSRTDFRLREDGEIFALETNTLPGMTSASLIPKEAAAEGMSFI